MCGVGSVVVGGVVVVFVVLVVDNVVVAVVDVLVVVAMTLFFGMIPIRCGLQVVIHIASFAVISRCMVRWSFLSPITCP